MELPAWIRTYDFAALFLVAGRIAVILALAWTVHFASHRVIRGLRIFVQRSARDIEQSRRIETLGRVFRYGASVIVAAVAGMLVLSELGIAIAPILGAAGVVGVAIGFGAQSLVKDFFNGLFILLEDQIHQGDVVEVGGKGGLVEEVTLRFVRLRDYSGNVHYVPNSLITTVTNMSRGFAFALMDIGVAYKEDIDAVIGVMRETGAALRADPAFEPRIIEDIEVAGVEQWADSAVLVRCRFKVRALEQWNVRREYLKRLKAAFDAAGIEIPYPHLTVFPGYAKDGSAPPFRVADEARAAVRASG
ncbi:MAG: mechanosensitive ion channel family protein [Gammaproteobacteria bacterium]